MPLYQCLEQQYHHNQQRRHQRRQYSQMGASFEILAEFVEQDLGPIDKSILQSISALAETQILANPIILGASGKTFRIKVIY